MIVQRLFSPLGRVFVGAGLACAYNLTYAAGVPEHGDVVNTWTRMALPILVVWWVESDARQTQYWPAYHYAWWLFAVWPAAIPHYVLRTRGRQGWPLALTLLAALVSPYVGWSVGVGLGILIGTYAW